VTEPANPAASEHIVRESLAAADRRRRGREASRRLWQAAPAVAFGVLALAALACWTGWPAIVPLAALGLSLLGLIVFRMAAARARPVSDAAAAAIDASAALGGELRSAAWFAGRPRDEWAQLHVDRAARRVAAVDWAQFYPAPRPRRAQLSTLVIVGASVALALTIPERTGIGSTAAMASRRVPESGRVPSDALAMLTPELQRQLEELLAAAERGDGTNAEALAGDDELQALLNQLGQLRDPEVLEALARALANQDTPARTAAEDMQALAERAMRAAESTALPKEMQEALERLSDELQIAGAEQARREAGDAPTQGGEGDPAESKPGGSQDVSIQFSKEADASGSAGMVMVNSPESRDSGGAPGGGVGGAGSDETAGAPGPAIEATLKQEIVEASQDSEGAEIESDIRRKTEHGDARVGFTNSAPAGFDKARTAAPPPVPEARRPGVQTYFVRKPQ
jgi:hypothetical protein